MIYYTKHGQNKPKESQRCSIFIHIPAVTNLLAALQRTLEGLFPLLLGDTCRQGGLLSAAKRCTGLARLYLGYKCGFDVHVQYTMNNHISTT